MEEATGKKVDLLICCGDFQAVRNKADLRCMAVPQKYLTMVRQQVDEGKSSLLEVSFACDNILLFAIHRHHFTSITAVRQSLQS